MQDYIAGQNQIATGTMPSNGPTPLVGGMTNPSGPAQVSQQNTGRMDDPMNWPGGMWQFITGLMNQQPQNSMQYGQ
jgi:hypothetical protein